MNDLNSVLIEGRLIDQPEIHDALKKKYCTFSIVSSRFFKQDSGIEKEETFIDIKAWGKLMEYAIDNGHKNRGIRVVGRISQERWNDDEGKPQSKLFIIAEHIEFKPEFKK
jgi:single-strand DNA-binding protein